MTYTSRGANIHILVAPSIRPEQFRLAANRLHCTELHLFTESLTPFDEWKEECDHMGIYFHEHELAANQIDMLGNVYNVGELVANRNVFLCLNSLQPLLCNMITQFISLELRHNHEELQNYYTNIGCFYQIIQSKILIAPLYPHWDRDCQLVIESLTTTGEGMTKKDLLEHIEVVQSESYSEDKLNRALRKLEHWLTGFQGFVKERRGTRTFFYEFKMLVEL